MTDDRTEFKRNRALGKALHQEQRLARAQGSQPDLHPEAVQAIYGDFIQPRPRVTQAQLDAQARKGWTDFHPEAYCHRCGGVNISWHTDSETWNRVMRPNGEDGRWGEIICPTCFVELAGDPHCTLTLEAHS